MSALRVLVVEDQPAVAKALQFLLEVNDIAVAVVSSPAAAIELVEAEDVGVVIQDMNFSAGAVSGEEGLALFRRLRAIDPDLPVLAMTAWSSLETAVEMVKSGAADYLAKPWDDTKLLTSVRNLLRMRELALENERLKHEKTSAKGELGRKFELAGLVYESAIMHRVVSLACQVASADVPVLITGPNGAGKEMIAEILHANSRRKTAPFVKVNAGALPDDLLEAELFGAESGAYTGSTKRRIGRFEAAHGGTLFLDEIGNLSAAGQMKLLRAVQRGEFERLGSSETRKVDVRILAATNADLQAAIGKGAFREDLFFRLNVIEIEVPALRARPEDVLPLASEFLARNASAANKPLSAAARAVLREYSWPGNVRELMNRIQRASIVATGAEITPEDLGLGRAEMAGVAAGESGDGGSAPGSAGAFHVANAPGAPGSSSSPGVSSAPGFSSSSSDNQERKELELLLRECDGMISRVAARLGVSRQALYRRMQRLGIVLERRPKT
ncbi:sigma-54-dependent transcriptional regulator [Pendulispora albinea]|uniref:Sigma-54 dependent transcriptional regulator n=1 Tax=Pendulispora albinea TaxID=2741071 RepID=A0ABZ2LPP1_9BACT